MNEKEGHYYCPSRGAKPSNRLEKCGLQPTVMIAAGIESLELYLRALV